METIIISRDSPIKLHALLESMDRYWIDHPPQHVVYNGANEYYTDGYEKCFNRYPDVITYQEPFKKDLCEVVRFILEERTDCREVMILTDDMVFVRHFEIDTLKELNNKEVLGISTNIEERALLPLKEKSMVYWKDCPTLNICTGTIFRVSDMLEIMRNKNWYTSNAFWDTIGGFYNIAKDTLGMSRPLIRLLPIPIVISVVDETHSLEDMNKSYLNNRVIDTSVFDNWTIYFGSEFAFAKYYFKWY